VLVNFVTIKYSCEALRPLNKNNLVLLVSLRGSIPGRGNGWDFLSSPPHADWLQSPPSLLSNGHQGLLPQT